MKKFVIPGALAVAAFAMALAGAQFAKGDGVARNRERAGEFSFVAHKIVRDTGEVVEGNLRFATVDRDAKNSIRIGIPFVRRMGVAGNKAEFGGPAFLAFRTAEGVREIKGHAVVNAIDNKKPDQRDGRPDVFAITFKPLEGDRTFAFEGPVARGDIAVGERDVRGG